MIERANVNQAEEILYVINESNREAFKKIIPKEHFREPVLSLEELLRDFQKMEFYVYKIGHKIVGVAALHIETKLTGRIRWVYILPEHQRKGIGTALISFLETKARNIGLKRLWLLTAEKAHWATSFYRKLGYEPCGKIERPWGHDVIMEKELK
jgi:N-acetylglutamate synthase-like GNAT family acetyltransferase